MTDLPAAIRALPPTPPACLDGDTSMLGIGASTGYTIGHRDAREAAAELAATECERFGRIRERNEVLERNAGTGGYGGTDTDGPPEEMWMTADPKMGCDAWGTWSYRTYMEGGEPTDRVKEKIAAGRAVPPVRYVRADVADARVEQARTVPGATPAGEVTYEVVDPTDDGSGEWSRDFHLIPFGSFESLAAAETERDRIVSRGGKASVVEVTRRAVGGGQRKDGVT